MIAESVSNALLNKMIKELTSLTCLIIALYDIPAVPACRNNDHGEIVNAIKAGNAGAAMKLMVEHFNRIEECLDLTGNDIENVDLEAALT